MPFPTPDGTVLKIQPAVNKTYEDGQDVLEKEQLATMAARQKNSLKALSLRSCALKENLRHLSVTGNLIPKERLIAVPHADAEHRREQAVPG
jgi:RNA polymerase-binding transcription factor DksA